MSEYVNILTKDLIGEALDWAVAQALGYKRVANDFGDWWHDSHDFCVARIQGDELEFSDDPPWSPSTSWMHGGPLIERFDIGILPPSSVPYCGTDVDGNYNPWTAQCGGADEIGRTPLIAICRLVVHLKLGGSVSIPAPLYKTSNSGEDAK